VRSDEDGRDELGWRQDGLEPFVVNDIGAHDEQGDFILLLRSDLLNEVRIPLTLPTTC
jgi:hypothetical protein